ncbi:MAG: response regulator [Spirochaetota bacterium]
MQQQILIVDDSSAIRQSLRYVIEHAGYSVIEACHGKDALAKIQPQTKLVISDINMPEMGGIEMVKTIRSGTTASRTVPIIILTTESHNDIKQSGKDAGATAWMVKPFPPEEIISTIKKIIG